MKSKKSKNQSPSAVRWFADLTHNDVASVGGKNASLDEMIRALKKEKVRVPDGFATTAEAYWQFLDANELKTKISNLLKELREEPIELHEAGQRIRRLFRKAQFPEAIRGAIQEAYAKLSHTRSLPRFSSRPASTRCP